LGTNMTRYNTRYIKEHYVFRKIRIDLYRQFLAWCGESSVNLCLEKALRILVSNTGTNVVSNTVTNTTSTREPSKSSATKQGTTTASRETKQKVVRWVKIDKIGNLEVYFLKVQDREGRPILWNNPSREWACWAFKEDVERVIEELNREKWPLNDIHKHEEGKELYRCGLIYKDGDVWKVAV